MGPVFPLVVTYNIALAYQLSAMQEEKEMDRRKRLRKSLKLYELAYIWQIEEEVESWNVELIIANNLGEIHRAAQNYRKLEKCLENLLSTMMYALMADYDSSNRAFVGLDGFVQNTSTLILRSLCAGAA